MSTDLASVVDVALSLPEQARAELAYKLMQSLPTPGLREEDAGFEQELERRVAAYEAGETSADDWENLSARLHQALDDRTKS